MAPPDCAAGPNAAALWRMRYATAQKPGKAPPSYRSSKESHRYEDDDEEDEEDAALRARHRERSRQVKKENREEPRRGVRVKEPGDPGDLSGRIDAALELALKNKKQGDEAKIDDDNVKKEDINRNKDTPVTRKPKQEEEKKEEKVVPKKQFDPLKPTAYAVRTIPFVLRKLQKFVLSPAPAGGGVAVRCFIERNRSGTNALFPVYKLYTDHEDGTGRFVMASRKLPSSASAHYAFSTSTADLFKSRHARSRNYLGKLRGDAATMTYTLYDRGLKPDANSAQPRAANSFHSRSSGGPQNTNVGGPKSDNEARCELACIAFSARRGRRSSNPRHLEVALPQTRWRPRTVDDPLPEDAETDDGGVCSVENVQPLREQDGLEHMLTLIQGQGAQNVLYADRAVVMHMRESKYDPLSSCLVDFKARASMASSKNFQLIKSPPLEPHMKRSYYAKPSGEGADLDPKLENEPQPVLLQMGKVGKHCFNMDYQFPLSMFQAFAICIARFDTRVPL